MPKANLPVDTVYDRQVAEVAQAVFQSLNDNQFCKTLKEEVMQRPDGDYEVILKSFAKKMPGFSNTAVYASLGGNKLKSTNGTLEVLEKYPQLQIAIPVNADKWDGVSKLHVVALPSNFQEGITKEVEAIAPDGSKVMLSVEKEPDFPVIVISENERSNKNGNILPAFNNTKPDPEINPLTRLKAGSGGFTGTAATSYPTSTTISFSTVYSIPETMYNYSWKVVVYRDNLSGAGYLKVAEYNSLYSGGLIYANYNDVSTLTNSSYSYYAVAQFSPYTNVLVEFQRSPTVSANTPAQPNFITDFSVKCSSPTTMELNWANINYANWTALKIEYQIENDPTWRLVADLPITTIYYLHTLGYPNLAYGKKYTYKLTVSNSYNQTSSAFKCTEFLSNRLGGKKTKITNLACDSYSVMRDLYESWLKGAPEWILEIGGVNPLTKVAGTYATLYWQGESSCCQDLTNATLYNPVEWRTADNGYITTYNLREDDSGSGTLTIACKLAAKVKLFDIIDFGPELTATYTTPIGSRDDQAGTAYDYFYNNADGHDLYFSRLKLTVKAAD